MAPEINIDSSFAVSAENIVVVVDLVKLLYSSWINIDVCYSFRKNSLH